MAAVHNLLPLHTGLRFGWDMQRFLHGRQLEHNPDDPYSCNIEVADAAITSLKFWGYCLMVDVFAWLFLYMSHWFDSCACHSSLPGDDDMSGRERRTYYRSRLSLEKCCMVCRRAPEMASGVMFELLGCPFLPTCATPWNQIVKVTWVR